MSVTKDQLYEAIQHVGSATAAKLGYFHDLPGGGGSTGPAFEFRRMTIVQDPNGGPGNGYILFEIDGPEFPFVDVTILSPIAGFSDQVFIDRISPTTVAVSIRRSSNDGGLVDPLNAEIGVRLQYMPVG